MLLDDSETEALKTWITKKLEDISDADADVLAEYVLALVKTDDPNTAATKANCIENLRDFLPDNHVPFVNELFEAIAAKAYDPSKPPPRASVPAPAAQAFDTNASRENKKRTYNDWQRDESQNNRINVFDGGDRPVKQARRGGGGRGHDRSNGAHHQGPAMFGQPHAPPMPPMMPPFDPNDPVASFMAMQQAMAMLPGMPGFPSAVGGGGGAGNGFKQRCRDYDTKGFCARGAACMYDHGSDSYAIAPGNDEYDPSQATLLPLQPNRTGFVNPSARDRGRGGNRGRVRGSSTGRGGGGRADVSHRGPNHDKSVTTVVVENIPDDHYSDGAVRAFFQQFGNIENVSLDGGPHKRLAMIKFDSYDSAKAAYDSPKVIFDNRFVKVYWLKAENANSHSTPTTASNGQHHPHARDNAEPTLDPAEVARKQEEAQRKHEEQKKQREGAERARQELDAKLSATESARQKLAAMLARKSGQPLPPEPPSITSASDESEQTKGLKAQLAKLEAEAKSLGIDPESASAPGYSYRGRGAFAGRARGRGRAGFRGARGGGVMRLDNRPKTVMIAYTDGGTYEEHEEALRQWLLFSGTFSSDAVHLSKHSDRADAALLAFPERYLGEMFMASAVSPDSPLAGKTDLSWFAGPVPAPAPPQAPLANSAVAQDAEVHMQDAAERPDDHPDEDTAAARDPDAYDVADEYDRWG